MSQATGQGAQPPPLKKTPEGKIEDNSLADLLEFFLNYDQKVALVRHPHVEELFQWKQKDDQEKGIEPYPFENAEARFAIGVFQAVAENNTEEKLGRWITDILQALGDAKQNNEDIAKSYNLRNDVSHVEQAGSLSTEIERRLYLTSCWIESLCTAETRFLGWVYQELYGKPFQPITE
ncbi:MAG: hypothetical protein HKN25_16060 [Pyrinomonadaceae bacterium]|nr:hypothetical protein [Pyrinomonadaceae bacterium]